MARLVFIYAAVSGIVGNIPGAVKKAFGGQSDCELCNITHGPVFEKKEWASFVKGLSTPSTFYHRNEIPEPVQAFLKRSRTDIPVVLSEDGGTYSVVVTKDELSSCKGSERCLADMLAVKLKNSPGTTE